jgi:hypothetical protein
MVTTGVPSLADDEIAAALAAGRVTATRMTQQGGIAGAVLVLQDRIETVGLADSLLAGQPADADRPDDIKADQIGEDCHA